MLKELYKVRMTIDQTGFKRLKESLGGLILNIKKIWCGTAALTVIYL